jgi:hypothetical protein
MPIQIISDLVDPDDPQGRTYKQLNADKTHGIPVGTLVELENGVRLFVVYQGRDCDQTPLYWLSVDKNDTVREDPRFLNSSWDGGYPESALSVVLRSLDDARKLVWQLVDGHSDFDDRDPESIAVVERLAAHMCVGMP